MQNDTILDEVNTEVENALVNASTSKRFVNNLLDKVVMYLILFGAALIGDTKNNPWVIAVAFLLILLYYPLMESMIGQTVAKMITRTRVVDMQGNKIGFWVACGRTICRIIPFEPLSFLFGSDQRGWHDTITNTRVVEQ